MIFTWQWRARGLSGRSHLRDGPDDYDFPVVVFAARSIRYEKVVLPAVLSLQCKIWTFQMFTPLLSPSQKTSRQDGTPRNG